MSEGVPGPSDLPQWSLNCWHPSKEWEEMDEAWQKMGLPEECWEGFAAVWHAGGCQHKQEEEWEEDKDKEDEEVEFEGFEEEE